MNIVIDGACCAQFVQVSENVGVSKKVTIFPTFFHCFSFSHKLIKYFMKVVGNSFVIMHPDIYSKPQLPITGCFGRTEVHLFSFRGRKGVNATKQKILRFLDI